MHSKVVELKGNRRDPPPPEKTHWFAQVDYRLSRIETMVTRLEWQIWLIVCGAGALLVLAIVDAVKAG